jgi:uridine phosphorylase
MPARLRPTAPSAADAILVGDPGRALMLAQELLQQPKMSNHARGLWGYTGVTHEGRELTVQSTGMGGPSATVVLHDLAGLGVRRAVRVGTGTSLGRFELGDLVIVTEANEASPDRELTAALAEELDEEAHRGVVTSRDALPRHRPDPEAGGDVADMQTAALFELAADLGIPVAALLIVSELSDGRAIADEEMETAAKRAGRAASTVLSP